MSLDSAMAWTPPCSSLALERFPARPAERGGWFAQLHLDRWVLIPAMTLLLLGLIGVASTTMALTPYPFAFLERQLAAAAAGMVLAALLMCIPVSWLGRASLPLALVGLVLLVLVLMGHPVKGSRRWLQLASFTLQPSEVARPLILLFLAHYAARRQDTLRQGMQALRLPLLVLGAGCVLLAAEPDIGDTCVLAVSGLAVLFLAGARLKDLARLVGLAALAVAVVAVASPYGLARLRAFLDPWAQPLGAGFQLTQSLIAFGSGAWLGVGLGNGVQKLFYLPEAHTDFLLASLAEELGLAGVCVTVLLFGVLVARSLLIARRAWGAGLNFQALVAACFGLWLGLQAFINMGVNMGVLPTKGLTLPLMSYGRSSLIVTLAALGVLLRVHRETCVAPHKDRPPDPPKDQKAPKQAPKKAQKKEAAGG